MSGIKKASDVRGNKIQCVNYQMCPLCFGCRAYDSRDPECQICFEDGRGGKRNFNVCDKEVHKDNLVNRMITKTVFEVEDKINFNNYGGKQ